MKVTVIFLLSCLLFCFNVFVLGTACSLDLYRVTLIGSESLVLLLGVVIFFFLIVLGGLLVSRTETERLVCIWLVFWGFFLCTVSVVFFVVLEIEEVRIGKGLLLEKVHLFSDLSPIVLEYMENHIPLSQYEFFQKSVNERLGAGTRLTRRELYVILEEVRKILPSPERWSPLSWSWWLEYATSITRFWKPLLLMGISVGGGVRSLFCLNLMDVDSVSRGEMKRLILQERGSRQKLEKVVFSLFSQQKRLQAEMEKLLVLLSLGEKDE